MENGEWKKVYGSIAAAILLGIICVVAFSFIDGMSGGFAIAFVSFFLGVSSLAVAGLYFQRARLTDAILREDQLLACWVYPDDEVIKSIEREYAEYKERNRALLIIMGVMIVAVALFFLIFVEDGGIETAGFMLFVLLILFIVSRVTPGLERARALRSSHDAYIARNGFIYQGGLYPFHSFLIRMTGVSFHEATGKRPPVLVFSFIQIVGRFIANPFEVSVPVPGGQEGRAKEITEELGG